jgi:hypothetical protein
MQCIVRRCSRLGIIIIIIKNQTIGRPLSNIYIYISNGLVFPELDQRRIGSSIIIIIITPASAIAAATIICTAPAMPYYRCV